MTARSVLDVILAMITMHIVIKHAKWFNYLVAWPVMVVPFVLMWVHVVGHYMQNQHIGSSLMQGSLHNIGVASYLLALASVAAREITQRQKKANTSVEHQVYAISSNFSKMIVALWTLGVAGGIAQEVINVTLRREVAIRQGYSGELDWMDIAAFCLGLIIIVINHFVFKAKVLNKINPDFKNNA